MKEKIQALMQKLSSVSSGKFSLSGANLKKGLSHKTSREKVILAVGITIAVFMFLFVVGIRPKLNQLKNAQLSLDRAKSGYNYILQNASRVSPQDVTRPDLGRRMEECVVIAARNNKIKGVNVISDYNKEKNKVKVQTDEVASYISVMNFVTELENRFGVTVDQITLDKQGDGIVYISNMILVRLDKGEYDD